MRRVGASIASNNINSVRFCEHLGFVVEGRIRQGVSPTVDLLKYGMLKNECRYLGDLNAKPMGKDRSCREVPQQIF